MKHGTAITIVFALLAGCATTIPPGRISDPAHHELGSIKQLKARAAFDLNCPEEQLVLTALRESFAGEHTAHGQIGTQGCGQRAVYVWVTSTGWVMDSGSGKAEPPTNEKAAP